jgi:hypothetical protein
MRDPRCAYYESCGGIGGDLRAGVNPSVEPAGKPSLVCTPRRSHPSPSAAHAIGVADRERVVIVVIRY